MIRRMQGTAGNRRGVEVRRRWVCAAMRIGVKVHVEIVDDVGEWPKRRPRERDEREESDAPTRLTRETRANYGNGE